MNSKTIVFIAFAVWSAICWRWYVCNIKEACAGGVNAALNDAGNGIVAEDTIRIDEVQTLEQEPVTQQSVQSTKTPPLSDDRIDEVQMELVEDRMVIHFPYNSIRKQDDAAIDQYLSRLASELIASKGNVTITGHTDFVGDAKTNQQFGMLRANSIRNILVKKGVAQSQVKTYSKGESKSVATNDTPQGRYRNRRVEIRVTN